MSLFFVLVEGFRMKRKRERKDTGFLCLRWFFSS